MQYLKDFNYEYDKDKNLITLVGKRPEEIAKFNFEDLDKGLEYKEAKDILDSFNLSYPSKMAEQSIERINRRLERVQNELADIKLKLRNRANFKKNRRIRFSFSNK